MRKKSMSGFLRLNSELGNFLGGGIDSPPAAVRVLVWTHCGFDKGVVWTCDVKPLKRKGFSNTAGLNRLVESLGDWFGLIRSRTSHSVIPVKVKSTRHLYCLVNRSMRLVVLKDRLMFYRSRSVATVGILDVLWSVKPAAFTAITLARHPRNISTIEFHVSNLESIKFDLA